MALADKIKEVEDAVVQTLIDAAISGVNGIVFVREIRDGVMNQTPYIHIFMDPSPILNTSSGGTEEWFFRVTIMAVAAAYNSEDADQARNIALQAGSAMIADRQLGHVVGDVSRIMWHADYVRELPDEQLFGSAIEYEITFQYREV